MSCCKTAHTVFVTKEDGKAIIPTKAHKTDAGWDLYSIHPVTIRGGERKVIHTGIKMAIPDGFVGLIWPRSGLSVKHGLDVLAGVIDSGYRGEIMVCLHNTNQYLPLFPNDNIDISIPAGEKIAQILFHKLPEVELIATETLNQTDRGEKGFGSSG